MIRVRCSICNRLMVGQSEREWPQYPFCSPRCKLIDLGRWLGGDYRIPVEVGEEEDDSEEISSESS